MRYMTRTYETVVEGDKEALDDLRTHLRVTTAAKRGIIDALTTIRASVPPDGQASGYRAGLLFCWWFCAEQNPGNAPSLEAGVAEPLAGSLKKRYRQHLLDAGLSEDEAQQWVDAANPVIQASIRDGCALVDRRQDWVHMVNGKERWEGLAACRETSDNLEPLKDTFERMISPAEGGAIAWLLGTSVSEPENGSELENEQDLMASQEAQRHSALNRAAKSFCSERYGEGKGMSVDKQLKVVNAFLEALDFTSTSSKVSEIIKEAASRIACSEKELESLMVAPGRPATWKKRVASLKEQPYATLDKTERDALKNFLSKSKRELNRRQANPKGHTWWADTILGAALREVSEHCGVQIDFGSWKELITAEGLVEAMLDAFSALSAHTTNTRKRVRELLDLAVVQREKEATIPRDVDRVLRWYQNERSKELGSPYVISRRAIRDVRKLADQWKKAEGKDGRLAVLMDFLTDNAGLDHHLFEWLATDDRHHLLDHLDTWVKVEEVKRRQTRLKRPVLCLPHPDFSPRGSHFGSANTWKADLSTTLASKGKTLDFWLKVTDGRQCKNINVSLRSDRLWREILRPAGRTGLPAAARNTRLGRFAATDFPTGAVAVPELEKTPAILIRTEKGKLRGDVAIRLVKEQSRAGTESLKELFADPRDGLRMLGVDLGVRVGAALGVCEVRSGPPRGPGPFSEKIGKHGTKHLAWLAQGCLVAQGQTNGSRAAGRQKASPSGAGPPLIGRPAQCDDSARSARDGRPGCELLLASPSWPRPDPQPGQASMDSAAGATTERVVPAPEPESTPQSDEESQKEISWVPWVEAVFVPSSQVSPPSWGYERRILRRLSQMIGTDRGVEQRLDMSSQADVLFGSLSMLRRVMGRHGRLAALTALVAQFPETWIHHELCVAEAWRAWAGKRPTKDQLGAGLVPLIGEALGGREGASLAKAVVDGREPAVALGEALRSAWATEDAALRGELSRLATAILGAASAKRYYGLLFGAEATGAEGCRARGWAGDPLTKLRLVDELDRRVRSWAARPTPDRPQGRRLPDPWMAEARAYRRRLRTDVTRQCAAAITGVALAYDCKVVVIENLEAYKTSRDRGRRENNVLMRWAHRELIRELRQECETFGILVRAVAPRGTSHDLFGTTDADGKNAKGTRGRPLATGESALGGNLWASPIEQAVAEARGRMKRLGEKASYATKALDRAGTYLDQEGWRVPVGTEEVFLPQTGGEWIAGPFDEPERWIFAGRAAWRSADANAAANIARRGAEPFKRRKDTADYPPLADDDVVQ